MQLNNVLVYFDIILYTGLILTGLLFFKRIDRLHRSFFGYFFLAGLLQNVAFVLGQYHLTNHFLIPCLIFAQIVGLGYFYIEIMKKSKYLNVVKLIILSLFVLFVIELFVRLSDNSFNILWYSHFFSNTVFSLVSFLVLLFLLKNSEEKFDMNIHIAVFLYSSVAALVFLFGNILANIKLEAQIAIWSVHTFVHIIFLFLIGFSLWKKIRS